MTWRHIVCQKFGISSICRSEALRVGFKTGGELNHEVNLLVKAGKAIPTRERYAEIFKSLCARHGVVFEGGIDAFLQGSWHMAEEMGLGEWRGN